MGEKDKGGCCGGKGNGQDDCDGSGQGHGGKGKGGCCGGHKKKEGYRQDPPTEKPEEPEKEKKD